MEYREKHQLSSRKRLVENSNSYCCHHGESSASGAGLFSRERFNLNAAALSEARV